MTKTAPSSVPSMDIADAQSRVQEIAVILYEADMNDPVNQALRKEAFDILDNFPEQSDSLFALACEAILTLQRLGKDGANDSTAGASQEKLLGPPGPVFLFPEAIRKALGGRDPTDAERDAIVFRTDALACGRTVAFTVACCEVFGNKPVELEVKRILGL